METKSIDMKKKEIWIYRITTGLFSVLIGLGATMYFVKHEMVVESFVKLGFPTFLIYPLAVVKILGLVAIWSNKFKTITEWAYAGFLFNLLLAVSAHINIGDGEFIPALVGLILVGVSYFYNRKLSNNS